MQKEMQNEGPPLAPANSDAELIDVLIAISVISKRLAEKLRNQEQNDKEEMP